MSIKISTGIDLSLTDTGICTIEVDVENKILLYTKKRIKSKSVKTFKEQSIRFNELGEKVISKIDERSIIAIEGMAYAANSQAHKIGGFWWSVFSKISNFEKVFIVPPNSLKKFSTSKGNASKNEMIEIIPFILDIYREEGWKVKGEEIKNDNEADAFHLALAALAIEGIITHSEELAKNLIEKGHMI